MRTNSTRQAVSLALAVSVLSAQAQDSGLHRIEAVEPHMGTLFRIVLYASDDRAAQTALRAAFDRVTDLDAKLSDYNPQSELMQATARAFDERVRVSADLFRMLEEAQKLAVESDGAFDVTLGPVIRLWRKARIDKRLPDAEDLANAKARSGYRNLMLDANARTIRLKILGVQLDLGGIAKGYAAVEALRVLREHQIPRALVAASGDLAIGDAPPEKEGWDVGIDPIDSPDKAFARVLKLSNKSVSTSGDSEQHLEVDGRRYSHIIDPRTGIGLTTRVGVTVIAPLDSSADGLATAASVVTAQRGVDAALKLIAQQPGVAAVIACQTNSDWQVRESDGLASLIK